MTSSERGGSGTGSRRAGRARPGDHPSQVRAVEWREDSVVLIDQRRLPLEEEYVVCRTWTEVAHAIREMVVRGAPAIGVTAAMGMVLAAKDAAGLSRAGFRKDLRAATKGLFETRPTAVNLGWALNEMEKIWGAEDLRGEDNLIVLGQMRARALEIQAEDLAACRAIGDYGAGLFADLGRSPVVLTHCNAGALATAGYGTALGVVRSAYAHHPELRVLVDETRPLLQGARLTAWELVKEGIPADLITDNMAGHFLKSGEITHVVVGADRIAANGDTANKIGTYSLSVLAREHGVPFLVAAPFSTVDFDLPDGVGIPIEERDPQEVTHLRGVRIAPPGVGVRNPAFDVTPAANITAIVTEKGVARPPFGESLAVLAGRPYPGKARLTGGAC
ncbi:MAG: S-methyl-5-thioribose-1-phosphate isomerase [Thermoleophilia bacterium]